MKYIITENRLNNFIIQYIEKKYPVNEINYTEGEDDYGNPDDSLYEFYLGDYDDNQTIFRWYDKEYWYAGASSETELVRMRVEDSPMLYFEDSRDVKKLDKMFGEHWRPVFKKWFYDNFGFEINKIL